MSRPAQSSRVAARVAAETFRGRRSVHRYQDESERHSMDILSCVDSPSPGFTTNSTLGLHLTPNLLDGRDVRVEMAGVAPSSASEFANVLATAAFFVVKDRWLCAPGVVFPGLLEEYELSSTVPHVLWLPPFPWDKLAEVDLGSGCKAHWLIAMPISEGERRFLTDRGFHELERLFAANEVEHFDLERRSVV